MKKVFSGPSGRKPWKYGKKEELSSTLLTGSPSQVNEWLDGFNAATMSERMPMRADAVNAHSGPAEPLIYRLMEEVHQQKRDAARLARDLRRAKVKHSKWTPPTKEEYQADIATVKAALQGGLKLEKPQGSSLHHFMQYMDDSDLNNLDREELQFLMHDFQSVVIEHDWAAAFRGVPGMLDDGDVPMPFDWTCFEFRISGLRLLVMMGEQESFLVTGVNGHWYVSQERFKFDGGKFISINNTEDSMMTIHGVQKFMAFVGDQIRAACIMLDASVAEVSAQPPSEALQKRRAQQGKVPLKSYHVVRLHRKHRGPRAEAGPVTGQHKRAHVRRGHWRHFNDGGSGAEQVVVADGHLRSRTWIHWMLVGDISLGFVDKEYRL